MKRTNWPLVSVVIPLYNHSQFVEKCLDSIGEDGYSNVEILVLDDGSTDGSYKEVERWVSNKCQCFSRIVLTRQANKGIAATLNRLIGMAEGDFITVLASDDYLLKGGIEARVDYLLKRPTLLAVFGDCLVVNEIGEVISESGLSDFRPNGARKKALMNQALLGMELVLRWSVPGPVFTMRRETCETVGYYDESLIIEDRDFYLRLLVRGSLGFVDYNVACYRWHGRNFGSDSGGRMLREEAMGRAALKASRKAKGLLRIALKSEYERRINADWQKKGGAKRIEGGMRWTMARIARLILVAIQDIRLASASISIVRIIHRVVLYKDNCIFKDVDLTKKNKA